MNPEIKAQWVAALRSGEYEQGQEYLHIGDSYCCLGVLCDLAVKAGVISETPDAGADIDENRYAAYDDAETTLPESASRWAGLTEPDGSWIEDPIMAIPDPTSPGNRRPHSVSSLNDSGLSFAKIADLIEEQL
jgi:hypothetical protein